MTTEVIDKNRFFKEINYHPYPKQQQYHDSTARFKVMVAGRRAGKSTMASRDLEPELFLPKRRYWIVGPSYDLGEKEFRVIWNDLIIGQQLGKNKAVKKAYSSKQGNMYIEFPWGTRIEVRSAQHPENLVGDGLHGVIMSEAAKHSEDTWERYIRPALADYRGWATFPTTPEGQNWLHKLWQYGRNPDFNYKDWESWQFPSWENRVLYPDGRQDEEILQIERTTSPEWFAQEIGADFTAFTGRIYSEFQEHSHVRSHNYNPAWKNVMVWDWGFVHPLACIEFQIDPWDNIYVWREHYGSYLTLEEHIKQVKDRVDPPGYRIDYCFGDAADPGAAATVTQNLTPCWVDPAAKAGIGVSGDAVWREGVELVKKFLRDYETGETDEYGTPVRVPKFFVDHACPHTIKEFNNYKAKEPPRNSRNKSVGRDTAQDYDNHCLDAIRYGLMHMYKLGAQHSLSEAMPELTGNYTQNDTIFKASDLQF